MNKPFRLALLTGFLWGLMEGLWLFIVPDILLSYWALKSVKAAAVSTVGVVLGACVASVLLYLGLTVTSFEPLLMGIWNFFPGYSSAMDLVANRHLTEWGAAGLTAGPTSGIPFRVYVLQAWHLDIALSSVLLWTPIARLERIVIAPLAVGALRWLLTPLLARWFSGKRLQQGLAVLIAAYWIGLYVWYWGVFLPNTY